MNHRRTTLRIAFDGMLLALLCVVGMFSIPFGDNIKVSLQLLMVFIIALVVDSLWDAVAVTGCYVLLGLVLPIYAGFTAGVTPTFGFVLSFVLAAPLVFVLNRFLPLPSIPRMVLACVAGLLVVYAGGTLFFMVYLRRWDLGAVLLITVVPYLPFDAVKILLAVTTVRLLPAFIVGNRRNKGKSDKGENS